MHRDYSRMVGYPEAITEACSLASELSRPEADRTVSLKNIKNICSIPCSWTLADYAAHNCADGSHVHFSRRQIYEVDQKGLVVWLKAAANRREKSVVYILPAPAGPSTKTPLTTGPVNTGLSNRVGEELATAFYEGREWARVMLQQINTRRGDSNRRRSDT